MLFNRNKRSSSRRKRMGWVTPQTLGIGFLLIALWLMLYYSSGELGYNQSPFIRFMMVPVSTIQHIRNFTAEMISSFADNFSAKKELAVLREAIEQYRADVFELRYKLRKFEAYQEALDLVREEDVPGLTAIVLGRVNRMTFSLIVDRGIGDSLELNMPVTTNIGLVGRISELTQHYSRVLPLVDPRSSIGIYIEGTPYEGVLNGTVDGDKLHLTDLHLVLQGDDSTLPKPGDLVFTSGNGSILPRNLFAGTVSEVTAETGYYVDPAVNVRSVKSVRILTNTSVQKEIRSLQEDD